MLSLFKKRGEAPLPPAEWRSAKKIARRQEEEAYIKATLASLGLTQQRREAGPSRRFTKGRPPTATDIAEWNRSWRPLRRGDMGAIILAQKLGLYDDYDNIKTTVARDTSVASTSSNQRNLLEPKLVPLSARNRSAALAERNEYKCKGPDADLCLKTSHDTVLVRFSSYSFVNFSLAESALPPSRRNPNVATPTTSTSVPHIPIRGVRNHVYLPVLNPTVQFSMPVACYSTRGVAIQDLLVFEGQCVSHAGEQLISEFAGNTYTSIDVVFERKDYPSTIHSILVKCHCGTTITRGQLAYAIALEQEKYTLTHSSSKDRAIERISRTRLMSLYTDNNGTTYRLQYAYVNTLAGCNKELARSFA